MSKKESYWFSHDSNTANHLKILVLINKYGYEGYGHWWRLLERMSDYEDYKYDIAMPFAWDVLGKDLRISAAATNTKKIQGCLIDGTSVGVPPHKRANETKSDNNECIIEEAESNNLTTLRNKALADGQRFVYPYVSTGRVNKEQLGDWLAAFNKWLDFTGEQVIEERDYRRHFAAWFRYREVHNEDPKLYNPTAQQPRNAQIPVNKTIPLPVAIPLEKPQGKYSKEKTNQYDMYWLKNLRNEVRSMGG